MKKKDLIIRNKKREELINRIERQGGRATDNDALLIIDMYSSIYRKDNRIDDIEGMEYKLIYMYNKIKEEK